MRRPISWADLSGARVGVWGRGVEGDANVRKLTTLGVEPVVVDDRVAADDPPGVLATTRGGLEALLRCDVVIKSPGISRYRDDLRQLEAAGVAVAGGLGLWLEEADRSRVLCVTGTKGKSTTVSIAGHLLRALGRRVVVGGNLGVPPWDPDVPADADHWVIEVSSFQSTDLTSSPPVVAVTSLHADHLDWHGDAETYVRDKLSLCRRPGADLTVANGDDPVLRAHAALLGPRVEWVSGDGTDGIEWAAPLGLLGRHNEMNARVARACLVAMGVAEAHDGDALAAAAAGFTGLESRLHLVGTVDGVDFVDDSLSTNVLPTVAALAAFETRPVALLAGGYDRGIDYAPLAEHLAARGARTLVLALPASGPRIAAAIEAAPHVPSLRVVECADLASAVRLGYDWARDVGGVVLLSPAAPSFGQFRDYRERAAAFTAAMAACEPRAGSGADTTA